MIDDTVGDGLSDAAPPVDDSHATTRDSITVALWTAISRVTGLVRVAVVAAVLGPTLLGNTYQFTNSVPNLVYYGLLGGALVSSLLVPILVRHIAAGDADRTAAVACGFLGCAAGAAACAVPIMAVVVPVALRTTSTGSGGLDRAQIGAALWLVVLLAPQIVCYAVVACSAAVMNAHRRFAVAAAAPTIENLGSLAVLVAVWSIYGTGREVTDVSATEIALLGVGTTGAVALHAAVQWCGARRCGVRLVPRRGWRDPEVRAVASSGGLAMAQAGLWAVQLIVAMTLANRVPGGVVAVMIASNFFFLPIALGATPIALATQPRLAGLAAAHREDEFAGTLARAVSLTVFVSTPAAAGYLVLAPRLAHVIGFGSMATPGARDLVSLSLSAVAVGVIGTGVFTVATYAAYARGDARSPLRAMTIQGLVAIPIMLVSLTVDGGAALVVIMGGLAAGGIVGAGVLLARLGRVAHGLSQVVGSVVRTVACAAVMAPVVWLCDRGVAAALPSRTGQLGALALAVVVGAVTYLLAQRVSRSPELALVTGSVPRRRRAPVGLELGARP